MGQRYPSPPRSLAAGSRRLDLYPILTRCKGREAILGWTQQRRHPMPQILVVTDIPDETGSTVVYRERIATADLESDHYSGQLVERVGWAVHDADEIEHRVERKQAHPSTRGQT